MKICLINNLYKPYNRGGAEQIVEQIADGLEKRGHDVFIITAKSYGSKEKIAYSKQKIYYLNSLYCNLNKIPKFIRLLWHIIDMLDVGGYYKIKAILKKEKPEIVMTHNLKGITYLVPKIIKKLNMKHFHTLHDIQLLHPSGLIIYGQEKIINTSCAKIYQKLCRILFKSTAVVISPSKWLMQMHQRKGFFTKSKQIILVNPTTIDKEKKLKTLENRRDKFSFLYIGQIEKHKGVLFLIKIFKLLCEDLKYNICELVIAGNGSKIIEARKSAGNNKNIHFLGRVRHDDLMMELEQFNVLIVPSLCYENSPSVIYEALSQGLPVIASRIGGITELINKTAGLLFEPSNGDDLMHRMKWAIDNKDKFKKISDIGREKIKNYNIDNYLNKLHDYINN